MARATTRTCAKGHRFTKTTDCPVCPICEAERLKGAQSDLPRIGAPATRALERIGVRCLADLTHHTKPELTALHGFGPKAMDALRDALAERGLSLKEGASR